MRLGPRRFEGLNALVVEDDDSYADLLGIYLERLGFSGIARAVTGLDAVEMAAEMRPNLVTMDLGLPDLFGSIAAIREICSMLPLARVIVFSARSDTESYREAIYAGAAAIANKSGMIDELIGMIHRCLKAPDRPFAATPNASLLLSVADTDSVDERFALVVATLTPRERAILHLIALLWPNEVPQIEEEAAHRLGDSVYWVRRELRALYAKLGADDLASAAAFAAAAKL